jgi:hypothetical protein
VKNWINLERQGLYIRNTHTPEFSRFLAVTFDKESSYEYLAERGEQEELAKYIPRKYEQGFRAISISYFCKYDLFVNGSNFISVCLLLLTVFVGICTEV